MKELLLQIVQKNSKNFLIRLTRNKQPVNIANWTLCFTVKKLLTDSDLKSVISKDILIVDSIDSQNGKCYLSLTSSETNKPIGNYYYELMFVYGDYREVFLRGELNIIPSLRQS
jgi:hypothetical protein